MTVQSFKGPPRGCLIPGCDCCSPPPPGHVTFQTLGNHPTLAAIGSVPLSHDHVLHFCQKSAFFSGFQQNWSKAKNWLSYDSHKSHKIRLKTSVTHFTTAATYDCNRQAHCGLKLKITHRSA